MGFCVEGKEEECRERGECSWRGPEVHNLYHYLVVLVHLYKHIKKVFCDLTGFSLATYQ